MCFQTTLCALSLLSLQHTACEHVRTLESSGVFNCSRAGPARGENEPYVGRGLSTPSNERRWPPENAKNSWSVEGAEIQKDGALDCSYRSRPSHLHCSELVQCAAWAHPAYGIATRLLARRIVVTCMRYRKTSWSETRTSFARSRRLCGRRSAHHCATL